MLQHELVKGANSFENDLDYWQDQTSTIMPYLPFFSNCLGFDKFYFSFLEKYSLQVYSNKMLTVT